MIHPLPHSRAGRFSAMIIMLLLSIAELAAGPRTPGVGASFRIFPSAVTQTETFITRHPLNTAILFASANTINLTSGFISEGIYISTDGGATWGGTDTHPGAPTSFHRGDPGIAIDKEGRFIMIRLGFTPGLYGHFSTDGGSSWSAQSTIATDDQDRATLVSDGIPASAHYGRTYATWVRFSPPFPVVFAYTDNGGASWTSPAQINNPPQRCQGGELAVGPDGTLHVTWASVINTSPFTEDYAGYARSTDGGASWTVTENIFDMNGIAGSFPSKSNIRVNGLPRIAADQTAGPRSGWVYIVTCERNNAPAGSDPDIILHRSSDGGNSWSGGIRVHQDALNNGKYQYFPAIHVDDGGGVNILYYDDRDTAADSSGVYLSRSTDGGDSWTDVPVSDHHFQPQSIGGLGQGYQGDNIGLTSSGNSLWPVWMDNFTGIYQIWTAPVDLASVGIETEKDSRPQTFQLAQNYPNPFNPATRIRFALPEAAVVQLEIFDVMGRRIVRALREAPLQAGWHQYIWDGRNDRGIMSPSGVYLYRMTHTPFDGGGAQRREMSKTRKMLLVR